LEAKNNIMTFQRKLRKLQIAFLLRKSIKKGHFDLLIIHPEYRDKGIGKKLINEGYKWFKEKGIKNFTVTTHALDKEASKFWKHQGFNEYNIKYEK